MRIQDVVFVFEELTVELGEKREDWNIKLFKDINFMFVALNLIVTN